LSYSENKTNSPLFLVLRNQLTSRSWEVMQVFNGVLDNASDANSPAVWAEKGI